jgi:hypothetical protein
MVAFYLLNAKHQARRVRLAHGCSMSRAHQMRTARAERS